jgi:hypothetical protein
MPGGTKGLEKHRFLKALLFSLKGSDGNVFTYHCVKEKKI